VAIVLSSRFQLLLELGVYWHDQQSRACSSTDMNTRTFPHSSKEPERLLRDSVRVLDRRLVVLLRDPSNSGINLMKSANRYLGRLSQRHKNMRQRTQFLKQLDFVTCLPSSNDASGSDSL
jgi:hypothetical protein